jgi:hypothetical protein
MRIICLAVLVACAVLPAHAQRDAVSAALSPERAGEVFQEAVVGACVPAVTGGGVSALAPAQRGRLQTTNDPEMRRQAGALPDETVWDVMDGKGVVTVREKAGRCVVSAYGTAVMPTLSAVISALEGSHGFERMVMAPPGGISQMLYATKGGKRVTVKLEGVQPGQPGNQSRFSVVTATVFVAP